MSDGERPREALANVGEAITSWIEAATDMGRTLTPRSNGVSRHTGVILDRQ